MPEGTASALYFVVANRERGIFGYTWRIGWSGTSFYIKARFSPLTALKVSLHGPHPRENLKPGFKIGIDGQAAQLAVESGGAYCGSVTQSAHWFSGSRAKSGVTHALTFRTSWDMFLKGSPSAPNPGNLKASAFGAVLPAPASLKTADVDVYVCDRQPYWPREKQARRDNACLGPLENKAGQYLTAVSVKRSAFDQDAPGSVFALRAKDGEDRLRGVATAADKNGVLWIVEHWMSVSALRQAISQQAQLGGPALWPPRAEEV